MICFEIWWNSADADAFRAKHEEHDGAEFKPVWDAAVRAMLDAAPAAPAVAPIMGYDKAKDGSECTVRGFLGIDGIVRIESIEFAPAQAEQQGDGGEAAQPYAYEVDYGDQQELVYSTWMEKYASDAVRERPRVALYTHPVIKQPSARVALSDAQRAEFADWARFIGTASLEKRLEFVAHIERMVLAASAAQTWESK